MENIRGPYLVTRSFMRLLLASSGKTILNITSGGAHFTSHGASAYQTTKFALLRLSEFTNVDHGEQGILAYSLHPGGVDTELAHNMPQEMQDRGEFFLFFLSFLCFFSFFLPGLGEGLVSIVGDFVCSKMMTRDYC